MSASPPAKIATIGLLGTMALVLMMLMSLSSFTDTGTVDHADHIRVNLDRSLAEVDEPVEVSSLRRVGRADAVSDAAPYRWVHTVRLHPSPAVSSDQAAVERLLARAARLLSGRLLRRPGSVDRIVCIAELGDGRSTRTDFELTMGADSPELEVLVAAR